MDPERYGALRALVDRALDLDTAARPAFVAAIDDGALRGEVALMLLRQAQPGLLDRPAAALLQDAGVPGAITTNWAERQLGRRIGAYRLERLLGAGGMGTVYAAQRADGLFEQTVAIKLVLAAHPGLHERFQRERQILAALRHPNIAQLLDGGETEDGVPYLIMEYVPGTDIARHLAPLPADPMRVVALLGDVARALAHAHRQGVIHRDIKPGNILCDPDGHVKLLDFGIAKLAEHEAHTNLTGHPLGPMTPTYAAPEQFQGGAISAATDVYQLGVLAFQLLTGRLPYRPQATDPLAWARAVAEQPPISLSRALREQAPSPVLPGASGARTVTGELDAIVRRCLAKRPEDRYQSMDALRDDLVSVRGGREARAHGVGAWLAQAGPPRPRVLVALLASAVVLAVAMVASHRTPDQGLAGNGTESARREAAARNVDNAPIFDAAVGFRVGDLQASSPQTRGLVEQAYAADNAGNRARGVAHLETAHGGDAGSPVPALLLAVWVVDNGEAGKGAQWLDIARARVNEKNSPWVRTYLRFADAVVNRQGAKVLQESGALLDQRPDAWVFRAGRSRTMIRRGDRGAALAELQRIEVRNLNLRRSEDVIADRASLGDPAGARAAFDRLQPEPDNPAWHALIGRLAYTDDDLVQARAAFLRASETGLRKDQFNWVVRGRMLAGIVAAESGDPAQAVADLGEARLRFKDLGEKAMVLDLNLLLAELLTRDDVTAATRASLMREASALLPDESSDAVRQLATLILLRLDPSHQPDPVVFERVDTLEQRGGAALIEARLALIRGDRKAALVAYRDAVAAGVYNTFPGEEARLVARVLGETVPDAQRIDPPIWPVSRFAARWAEREVK